jgi:hypothetical protein
LNAGLDLQKVSDAKEAAEEAAAISQYELRIAREDIKSLQESLERHKEESSSAAEQGLGPVTPRTPQRPQGHHKTFSASLDNLSSTEKRDLNSAVQEYLKAQGYKLTAMTFCDEVSASLGRLGNSVYFLWITCAGPCVIVDTVC